MSSLNGLVTEPAFTWEDCWDCERSVIGCLQVALGNPWRSHAEPSLGQRITLLICAFPAVALTRSEPFPRFLILALLLPLGQARVVVSHALLLRPLPRGTPLVVLRPVAAEPLLPGIAVAANAAAIDGRGVWLRRASFGTKNYEL
jgi:hypothetical protein